MMLQDLFLLKIAIFSTISKNNKEFSLTTISAQYLGGGMSIAGQIDANLFINSTTFDSNFGASGGGLYIDNTTYTTIINSKFLKNACINYEIKI